MTVQNLSDWGVEVSVWLHDCPCAHALDKERSTCNLKGRNALPLACGAWHAFTKKLQECGLSPSATILHAQLKSQTEEDKSFASHLLSEFHDCKAMMLLRLRQAFSFWDALPFAILRMGRHLAFPATTEDESRTVASHLLKEYEDAPSKASLGVVSWFFFGQATNHQHIISWINGEVLHYNIVGELLGLLLSGDAEAGKPPPFGQCGCWTWSGATALCNGG